MTIPVSTVHGACRRGAIALILLAGAASTATADDRTANGSNNNIAHPNQGAANTPLLRLTPPAYTDGLTGMPRGDVGPRDVSNAVVTQHSMIYSGRGLSDFVWQWGQFLDHDLDLTPDSSGERVNISTPVADVYFQGSKIPFTRSLFDPASGITTPRQQLNINTAYLDGSMIYGSDQVVLDGLRTHVGGRLRTTSHPTGDLLPFNTTGLPNNPGPMGGDPASFFVAGDIRCNEQTGLTCMHTLWMREHNHWADTLSAQNPTWTDEQVYQLARKIVGGEIEAITFNEWIPTFFGPGSVGPYPGYDPSVDSTIATEFSSAAFRIGHTLLSPTLLRLDNNGHTIPEGNLSLRETFFNPSHVLAVGIEPVLRGLATQMDQEVDNFIIDDVRNFLFGPPGAGGMDLASLNIQRSRDHGLPDYNTIRVRMGLPPVQSFSEMTLDPNIAAALATVYPDVNSVDPWVGMLAEAHMPGSSVGPTMTAVILDQFQRARAGDRYWYQNDPDIASYLNTINTTRLSDVIRRNTSITHIQDNVFIASGLACPCDWDHSGMMNSNDFFSFLTSFFAGDADINNSGHTDTEDFYDFLTCFFGQCQ